MIADNAALTFITLTNQPLTILMPVYTQSLWLSQVTRCDAAQGRAGAAHTALVHMADATDMIADDAALALADAEGGSGRGGKEAARLAASAARELNAALEMPLFVDRRKFVPVADALAEAAAEARRGAADKVGVKKRQIAAAAVTPAVAKRPKKAAKRRR